MIHHEGPPPFDCFEALAARGVPHAVFTRLGGHSQGPFASLNVGHTVGDDPACVEANHAAIYAALGLGADRVVSGRQVHGCRVVRARAEDGGRVVGVADALFTTEKGLALLQRYADCVPILLAGPGVVGIAHAGWRGTLARVAAKAALAMAEAAHCRTDQIIACIGPSIGPCCFEIGPEVVSAVRQAFPQMDHLLRAGADGKAHFDLWEANAAQLRAVGVGEIEPAAICTRCRRDLYFSHRGDGGRTGRFAALIVAGG